MAWQGFEVFRRRQKMILAILAVLAMVLFIIGDVLIGTRYGTFGLGYGLRRLFYDTRLEELLLLHDRRLTAFRTLAIAHARATQRWLTSRFQVQKPDDIKDENLRKEYEREYRRSMQTWSGQLISFPFITDTFSLDAEGLLQFAYWKEEADRLGIVLATSTMRQDFERFTFAQIPESELQRILHQDLRSPVSVEELFQWCADEIRAALARRVACGTDPQRVVPLTLLDLWEAYRELGTTLPQVAFITFDVRAERFLQAVAAPSDQELRDFFEQHKQREPDPLRAEPGFRIPNRYRVEFIYADARYDPKDPAKLGEAWPHYRQLAESIVTLPRLMTLNPAGAPAGSFLPTLMAPGSGLKLAAFQRYSANQGTRFRLHEPGLSYALSNTALGQPVHHHGLLPPGSGPWYRPTSTEAEQATQAVLQGASVLGGVITGPGSLLCLRPISIKAPYVVTVAGDLAAHVAHSVSLSLALAAPVVAGQSADPLRQPEPEATPSWHTTKTGVEAAAAASLVGFSSGPGIPVWLAPVLQEWFVPPQSVPPGSLLPGWGGLAFALWAPPSYVPFADVESELELEFLRGEVGRWLGADLRRLQQDLTEYRQVYDKAYQEWRKSQRKPTTERFPPPPFGPNKEPLEAYLHRFCQARGLRYFPMPQPRSRFELMPRAAGELGKILYPLYREIELETASHPMELFRQELAFADLLISGQGLLVDPDNAKDNPISEKEFGLYQPRHLVRPGVSGHRALVWKAEEVPGRVPRFEEVREQVLQAWRKQKASAVAREHAQRLAERIRKPYEQRQAPVADILRELRGDPDFPELELAQTVELRRYQLIHAPLTGLEKGSPLRPSYRAVRYPPILDYPETDFLEQAFYHLRHPGDTWITRNLPDDKVYLLVMLSEPRSPTTQEFAMDYLRRGAKARLQIETIQGRSEGISLEAWASTRRYRQYREQFVKFLRQRYGLDDEKWRQLQDHTRRAAS